MDAHFVRKPGAQLGPDGMRADVVVTTRDAAGQNKKQFIDVTVTVTNTALSAAAKKKIGASAEEASRKSPRITTTTTIGKKLISSPRICKRLIHNLVHLSL